MTKIEGFQSKDLFKVQNAAHSLPHSREHAQL